jgi:hypothetical protein
MKADLHKEKVQKADFGGRDGSGELSMNYAIRFSGPGAPLPSAASGMASDPTSFASSVLR